MCSAPVLYTVYIQYIRTVHINAACAAYAVHAIHAIYIVHTVQSTCGMHQMQYTTHAAYVVRAMHAIHSPKYIVHSRSQSTVHSVRLHHSTQYLQVVTPEGRVTTAGIPTPTPTIPHLMTSPSWHAFSCSLCCSAIFFSKCVAVT